MKKRVVHLTTAHHPLDNRIFEKECKTLAVAGFEVILIAPHPKDFETDGVRVLSVPSFHSRANRFSITLFRIIVKALRTKAQIYHFHDPDLIPVGIILRLLGKQVIYDVHEDYVSSIRQKEYIPKFFRNPLAYLLRGIEKICTRFFEIVIAENYYARFFPQAIPVLNYPKSIKIDFTPQASSNTSIELIYAGNVTADRGAFNHARLLDLHPQIRVHMIGKCRKDLADQLYRETRDPTRLLITGIDRHVPFSEILEKYAEREWTAGLAIFPDTAHYREKELTKLFEYMAVGIPILSSNFPTWRKMVEENRAGICVPPENMDAAITAIQSLRSNPDLRASMILSGKSAYRSKYTWESQGVRLIELYQSILGQHAETRFQ